MNIVLPNSKVFTVIISISSNDRVDWFISAFRSVLNQTAQPNQIVITVDGQISESVRTFLHDQAVSNLTIKFEYEESKTNIGRGRLLARAVVRSKNDLIAIMDADDECYPDRFEKQLKCFQNYPELAVVGGCIEELDPETGVIYARKNMPELHEQILEYAKWRNPINQMTVMFKREAVLKVGNYESHHLFEDMWLWYRMLNAGCQFYNLPDVLVKVRAGEGQLKRRSGFSYAKSEVKLYFKLYRIGFFDLKATICKLFIRLPLRLMPVVVFKRVFSSFLRD